MIYHIHPVAKSPTQTMGRIGPKEFQDWYRSLVLARKILEKLKKAGFEACILIVTGFQMKGERSEADIFFDELVAMGVPADHVKVVKEGFHTGDQVNIAERYVEKAGGRRISISTVAHFPHVMYYSHPRTSHKVVLLGLPNIKEVFKDPFMLIVAWVIDRRFEWRMAFEEWVIRRRKAGNL